MISRIPALTLVCAVAFAAVPAGAQLSAPNTAPATVLTSVPTPAAPQTAAPSASVATPGPVGPVSRASAVFVQPQRSAALDLNSAAMATGGRTQSRAMMIVGAAALITGAIIGGDPGTIVMVGGAVVGLIGLYNYLQ